MEAAFEAATSEKRILHKAAVILHQSYTKVLEIETAIGTLIQTRDSL